jgi:hypothetical protein
MRFERKYRIEGKTVAVVKQMLRFHPAGFSTLYPDRQVNNIYFDTETLDTYRQNVYGVNERKKFRVRWYGENPREIRKPQFEIKIKHNELGDKEVYPIDIFSLDDLKPVTHLVSRIPRPALPLKPVLLNSYHRSYFISADKQFRVTIDHELRYHSLLNGPRFRSYQIKDDAIIVEIKYDERIDDRVNFLTQRMPFRQEKHSKYVNGVTLTN